MAVVSASASYYRKIIVAGDPEVGKTSLIKAFLELNGTPEYIGIFNDFANCDINVDNSRFILDIFEVQCLDCMGINRKLLERIDVVILCYAVDNKQSFLKATDEWLNDFKRINPTAPIVLVATKCDLRGRNHRISHYIGEMAARNMNAYQFIECSALNNENVIWVFVSAVRVTLELK